MPPFDRIDDWGAFWRHDVIGWEGYWIFIFATQMYIGIAVLVYLVRWFRANEMGYWKEWLFLAILVTIFMALAPWKIGGTGKLNALGDNGNNIALNACFAKMANKDGFTWSTPTEDDARIMWRAISISWRGADTQFEAIIWKIAWSLQYLLVLTIPTRVIFPKSTRFCGWLMLFSGSVSVLIISYYVVKEFPLNFTVLWFCSLISFPLAIYLSEDAV